MYVQWRIQDLAQGGGQNGREAPENFFVPPLSSSGGGQGGTEFAQGGDKTGAKRPKICLSPP